MIVVYLMRILCEELLYGRVWNLFYGGKVGDFWQRNKICYCIAIIIL